MRTLVEVLNYAREAGMTEREVNRLADEVPSVMTKEEYQNIILGIDCEMEWR